MKVYCSHSIKKIHTRSNFTVCNLCPAAWYNSDPIPMVVIGYTEPYEVDENYLEHLEPKDLSQKTFTRCTVCKDLLEKRKHTLCDVKAWWKQLGKRHTETLNRVFKVVKGFKK